MPLVATQTTSRLRPAPELVRQLEAAVQRAELHQLSDSAPAPIVVAVSGGRDSVALLHLLADAVAEHALTLHVAHLDHALRPESSDDADFVAALASSMDLPCTVERLADDRLTWEPGGLENGARRLRYRFLLQTALTVAGPDQVPTIALAHHADDQLETLLLHLVRGSGLDGLTGMREVSETTARAFGVTEEMWVDRPVRLWRPLLEVESAAISDYAAAQNLTWRDDDSNQDLRLARNRLRHMVVPQLRALNPSVAQAAGRAARILAGERSRLHLLDTQVLRTLLVEPAAADWRPIQPLSTASSQDRQFTRIRLDLAGLLAQDEATAFSVLRLSLQNLGAVDVELQHIEQILTGTRTGRSSGPHPIVGDLCWSLIRGPADRQATLSLHHADTLPDQPDQPLIQEPYAHIPVPENGSLALEDGWTLVCRTVDPAECPKSWTGLSPWEGWFDAAAVTAPVLTTPQPGMRMAPLGLHGHHRAVGDMLTDANVHTSLRPHWPVLTDETTSEVHWLCGLRCSERSKVGPSTRHVRYLRWVRPAQKERT